MTFPTTSWATLADATLNGGEAERAALERFCERYWKPVSVVIRSRGAPPERVEDLTQDFFLKMIEGKFVRRASRENGKFRYFLLKALKNFLADDVRKNTALKRGGGLQRVELRDDSAAGEDDSLQFDQAWAEAVFESAVEVTGERVIEKRGEEKWAALRYFLAGDGEVTTYEELGQVLGMTDAAVKTEVSRLRGKFRANLRREVAKTVSAPHEVEEELAFLREAMMRKPADGNE